MNSSYTLTLTRWHKVAERLSREYTEAVYAVKQTLTQTRVSTYLGQDQEVSLQLESHNAEERLQRAFRVQDALADVRRVIGDANVHHGVSAKLAEFDKLNRRLKVVTELIEAQSANMVSIEQLKNIPQDYVADGSHYESKRPQLHVRMLGREAIANLKQEFESIRARAYALSDEIANLNRATANVALSKEVATLAGI